MINCKKGHDECPIAPVLLGDAKIAGSLSNELFEEGIYVIGFSYPVVPKVDYYYYFNKSYIINT